MQDALKRVKDALEAKNVNAVSFSFQGDMVWSGKHVSDRIVVCVGDVVRTGMLDEIKEKLRHHSCSSTELDFLHKFTWSFNNMFPDGTSKDRVALVWRILTYKTHHRPSRAPDCEVATHFVKSGKTRAWLLKLFNFKTVMIIMQGMHDAFDTCLILHARLYNQLFRTLLWDLLTDMLTPSTNTSAHIRCMLETVDDSQWTVTGPYAKKHAIHFLTVL